MEKRMPKPVPKNPPAPVVPSVTSGVAACVEPLRSKPEEIVTPPEMLQPPPVSPLSDLPVAGPSLKSPVDSIPIPKKWDEKTAKEIREIQTTALKGRHRALRTFRRACLLMGLGHWTRLPEETRTLIEVSIEKSFMDKDLVGRWVSYLNTFGKPSIPRRKFEFICISVGMEILADAAKSLKAA